MVVCLQKCKTRVKLLVLQGECDRSVRNLMAVTTQNAVTLVEYTIVV